MSMLEDQQAQAAIIGTIPAASRRRAGQLVVVVCTSTPAPKVRKIVNPVSAGEGWCKGPARNVPASPANSPPTANAVHTPVVAARNWPRPFAGA